MTDHSADSTDRPDPFLEPYSQEQGFSLWRQVSKIFQLLLGYFALIVGLVVLLEHRELRHSSTLLFEYIIYTLIAEFVLFGATCIFFMCQVFFCNEERVAYCYPICGIVLQVVYMLINYISFFTGIFFIYAYIHADYYESWAKLAATEKKIYPILVYISSIVLLSFFALLDSLPFVLGILKTTVDKLIAGLCFRESVFGDYSLLGDFEYQGDIEDYARAISIMKHPYFEFSERSRGNTEIEMSNRRS